MADDGAKKPKKAPARPEPYGIESVEREACKLSEAELADLARWLIAEQKATGVLEHVRRYLLRCAHGGCMRTPVTRRDCSGYKKRSCGCGAPYCAEHFKCESACANLSCVCSHEQCCERCRRHTCDECAQPLCADCWRALRRGARLCDQCGAFAAAAPSEASESSDESTQEA
jgi:hypothetical protein